MIFPFVVRTAFTSLMVLVQERLDDVRRIDGETYR
jgi:hypothetical protein